MARVRTFFGMLLLGLAALLWLGALVSVFAPFLSGPKWLSVVGLIVAGELAFLAGAGLAAGSVLKRMGARPRRRRHG